ncbi:MAG: hypothetical protein IJ180_09515 [Bacteroidales bacterium]|nr:hypothetical protein [Bacteroidales bacterium]
MSKVAKQSTAHVNGKTALLKQQTLIDDTAFLPPASDLAEYQKVDSGSVQWIKERAEQEQKARIKFNEDRIKLAKKELNGRNVTAYISIIAITFIAVLFIGFAFYLVSKGYDTKGTLFGSGAVLLIAYYLFNMKKTDKKN